MAEVGNYCCFEAARTVYNLPSNVGLERVGMTAGARYLGLYT